MRVLIPLLFAFALPAQAPSPRTVPSWFTELQNVQRDGYQAALGALDSNVEHAWRAALQEPQHPEFLSAVQMASGYYRSQGYDLKAEQVLNQAIAVIPDQVNPQLRRNLERSLADHFENTQQLVKALAIREKLARTAKQSEPAGELSALARLYDRMGEVEKAEATLKETIAARQSQKAEEITSARVRNGVGMRMGDFQRPVQDELAQFYLSHGRAAEAEQTYKQALAAADQASKEKEFIGAADAYVNFLTQQRRFDESVKLTRTILSRLENSTDPGNAQALFYRRQSLASLLTQAGRLDEALELQKETAEIATQRSTSSHERFQALSSLAQTLVNQNRLEEAEKAVAELRKEASGDPNFRYFDSMALQMLGQIRDKQKRPEEAAQVRAGIHNFVYAGPPNQPQGIHDILRPVQQSVMQGSADVDAAAVDRALKLASERIQTNPQELSALTSTAVMLMSKKPELAHRVIAETLALIEQAPEHPRIADVLGSLAEPLAGMRMSAEAERVIERQERILVRAKGPDAVALNNTGYGRIALMQREPNWPGVVEERQRMLARVEKATGPKSRESLYALREVAWAFANFKNWPEEERILTALQQRTLNLMGPTNMEYSNLLEHMANRASMNQQHDQALEWMDKAIEVARSSPNGAPFLSNLVESRKRLEQARNAPAPNPFFGTGSSSTTNRWFDTNQVRDPVPAQRRK